jgi:hypothetical protein
MFSIGQIVNCEIGGKKTTSTIIGWKLNNNVGYVVTDFFSQQVPPMKSGDAVIMSMENKGSNYRAVVVYTETLPKTGLLFVLKGDEENTILMKSLRLVERFQCLIPATIAEHDNEKFIITDISENGLSLQTKEYVVLPPDSSVTVAFNAGGVGNIANLSLKIIRSKTDGDQTRYATKFDAISQENKDILSMYADLCRDWTLN